MATLHLGPALLFIAALLLFFCQLTASAKAERAPPKALVVPITKDSKTLRYTIELLQGTPLRKLHLMLDTTLDYNTVRCDAQRYVSSSYAPVGCSDGVCKGYAYSGCGICYLKKGPGCNNDTCVVPLAGSSASFELARDVIALRSTQGSNPGRYVNFSGVVFSCGYGDYAFNNLPAGAAGSAGITASTLALPAQLTTKLHVARKFAICLPSTSAATGALFFGGGPYVFLPPPGKDLSKGLVSTSLVKNDYYLGDFYVGLTGITVNDVHVSIDKSSLVIENSTSPFGRGGTKLDMMEPYTRLATPIFNSLVDVFTHEAKKMNITRVASVDPFGACYSSKRVGVTRVGPAVPTIDLIFENNATYWRIFGANSMVQVSDSVMCLGFVDRSNGGLTTIRIGTYQMQDNLLAIDLATSRLSFSSSLLFRQTTCSNFNFTSST